MIVPSFSEVTLIPLIVQVPAEPTVVVWAEVEFVPSETTKEIVAPTSPVPLAVVAASFVLLTGLVTDVIATAGATVSLVAVLLLCAELPEPSVAVAV